MPVEVIDLRVAEDWRDVVHRAVQTLAEGKLVVFPTETVYGLAASALDQSAVERLIRVKGRRPGQPLTLAIRSAAEARDYAPDLSALAQRLARRCWPGPITLVLDDSHPQSLVRRLPSFVQQAVSPSNAVGLRVPGHQLILDVMQMIVGPLVLSSANRSGQPDAVTAAEVLESLGDEVDLLLDDGRCRFAQPSSVVKVVGNRYEVLRAGVVPEKTIQRLSSVMLLFVCTGNTCRSPLAEVICCDMLAKQIGCHLDELEDHGVIVMSAGVAAMMGGTASAEAIQVAAELGLDLTSHQTQPVNEQLVRHADVIFTMTRSHREAIVEQWPEAAERTELLAVDESDICDPIGGPLERYRFCAAQIQEALAHRLKQIELPSRK